MIMILKLVLVSVLLGASVAPLRAAAPDAPSAADVATEVEILRLREALAREVRSPVLRWGYAEKGGGSDGWT